MELYGSNAAFGAERVELSEKRAVLPIEGEAPRFPLGVGGLLPVETRRKDGSLKTVYAFPLDEVLEDGAEAMPDPAAAACAGEDEAPQADGAPAQDGAACAPAVPADVAQPMRAALEEALALLNRMLGLAAKMAGYPFGQVYGVQVGVGEKGWGFTRVDVVPLDAHGAPSASPLHLHVETAEVPASPGSLGAVVEYGPAGDALRVTMTEYVDEDVTVRAVADVNPKSGKLSIRKVERIDRYERTSRLLYKRGQEARSNTARVAGHIRKR